MKELNSKLFPGCFYKPGENAVFYNIIPEGFDSPVEIYLSGDTTLDDAAANRAGRFFDDIKQWDTACRDFFTMFEKEGRHHETLTEYFAFHQEEVPGVFGVPDPKALSFQEMVACLTLCQLASYGDSSLQMFTVDFALRHDQLLSVYFDSTGIINNMTWDI